jgi:hypothetical protein
MFAGSTSACEKFAGTNDGTAEKHTHAIMSNGMVMPECGHSHGLDILSIDLGEGVLSAVTTSGYDYLPQPVVPGEAVSAAMPGPMKQYEHRHVVRLTKDSASNGEADVTGAHAMMGCPITSGGGKDVTMKINEMCAALRKTAAALKDKDAEASALLEQQALDLEKEVSADNVEVIIAAKIKDGALITKEVHEQAVSAAKQAGKDELQKEISAAAEVAAKQAEATKVRMEKVVSAGLKAESVQSAVNAIPAGPDGDKVFDAQLATWTSILSAKAPPKNESTASAGAPAAHLLGAVEGKTKQPLTQAQRQLALV